MWGRGTIWAQPFDQYTPGADEKEMSNAHYSTTLLLLAVRVLALYCWSQRGRGDC